jgi:predicted metal-binding membrane protein
MPISQAGPVAGASGPAAALARAPRRVLIASAGVVTLAAWLWVVRGPVPHHVHLAFLPAHRHHPFDFWAFVFVVAMWQAMMVAMMTPAVVEWLLTFAALTGRERGARRASGPVAAFAAGYFVIWLGYSLLAAILQTAVERAGFLEVHGRLPAQAGGAVLIGAGLLYFTPFNRACLSHCRNPLTYFLTKWKNGPRGGFRMGLMHGAYCVGCCWALMITGFAMGVMNVLWMVFLTLLISVEKLAPGGNRIGAAAAVGMTIWGLVLLF